MDQEGALGVKIFLGFIAALGILALPASSANAAPIEPGQVEVLDGDTICVRVVIPFKFIAARGETQKYLFERSLIVLRS